MGENKLVGLNFVLRRGDDDQLVVREDKEKGKVYGGRFHEKVPDDDNWVARLQRTLAHRGFCFDSSWLILADTAKATFDSKTEWAVREFQIAAGYPFSDQNGAQFDLKAPANKEAAYIGLPTGVLNEATLKALLKWDAIDLVCPIEISGFGLVNTDETSGTAPDPIVQQPNLWRDDEISTSSRVFARDRSGEFYRPGPTFPLPKLPRDPAKYQVLGGISPFNGAIGPVTDARHAWARSTDESEVLPRRLFDLATGADLELQISTYRIIRSVADVECSGFFEGGNAYDTQVISFGLAQWTVHPEFSGARRGGELPAFLAYFRQRYPEKFENCFGKFGLFPSVFWLKVSGSADGESLLNDKKRTYEAVAALIEEDQETHDLPGSLAERRYLRNWHWLYRFVMAGRGIDEYRRSMWDMARIRLRMIMEATWQATANLPGPYPTVGTGGRPAKLGETFRSEQTLAMLLRWNIISPGDIRSADGVGSELLHVYTNIRNAPPFQNHDVTTWDSRHEWHLARALLARFQVDDSLRKVAPWLDTEVEHSRSYLVTTELRDLQQLGQNDFIITGTDNVVGDLPLPNPLPDPAHQGEFIVQWTVLNSTTPATNRILQCFASGGITLTDGGARVGRIRPNNPRQWYVEEREVPQGGDAEGALLRRFHLKRAASSPFDISVRELPILSQKRFEPLTAKMFKMDLSGLPRFKLNADPVESNLLEIDDSTTAGKDLIDALTHAIGNGGSGTLSGALFTTLADAVTLKLPSTDVGLVSPAPFQVVESGATVRWLVETNNKNLPFLTIRRVDAHKVALDCPGLSLRYGGKRLQRTATNQPQTARLREDLTAMGFDPLLVSDPNQDLFDERVEAAVRAFQTYSLGDLVGREANEAVNWVEKLVGQEVDEPLRYHGPVNGIVNDETRALIDHWIAKKWRCPVVVDARTLPVGGSIVPQKGNLWRHDEHPNINDFFFVTDFSQSKTPTAKPLAVYRNGPSVQNITGFLPAESEIGIATLTGAASPTDPMKSTVKVLKAVAVQLPCKGFLDGVDASDANRVINLGAFDLRDKEETVNGKNLYCGRLGALLSLARAVEPAAFGKAFNASGIRASVDWTNGPKVRGLLIDDPNARLLAKLTRQSDVTEKEPHDDIVQTTNAAEWHGWHSVYRLALAARQSRMGRAYYDLARLELLGIGALPVTAQFRLQAVVTTERAWAMLLFWHARHPADIAVFTGLAAQKKRALGTPLQEVITRVEQIGLHTHPHPLPFNAGDAQDAVIQAIIEKVTELYSAGAATPDVDFFTRMTALSTDAGLSDTFLLDRDHLPHFKAGVAAGVITAFIPIGKAPTNTGGAVKPSIALCGAADLAAKTFRATEIAFTLAAANGDFHSLCFPLSTPQDLDLELEDPGSVATVAAVRRPGETPESLPLLRFAQGSDISDLTDAQRNWSFRLADALGDLAIPVSAKLSLASLAVAIDGTLDGDIKSIFDLEFPFGDKVPLSVAGIGDTSGNASFSSFDFDELNSKLTAPVPASIVDALKQFLQLPANAQIAFQAMIDGDRFAASFATGKLDTLALDLVPTLVSLNLKEVELALDSRTGLGIKLPQGDDRAKGVSLASDLFADAGANAVINHACEAIGGAADSLGRVFGLSPEDANGILLEPGANLVSWNGRKPKVAAALMAGLTKVAINQARRLRSFAGELLGGLAENCHARFADVPTGVGAGATIGRDTGNGLWFIEVPLQLKFNDSTNHANPNDAVDQRDFLSITGRFRFTCPGDETFVDFGAGSFCVDPEIVMEVHDDKSHKGRSFGNLVSLHVPEKSVFVFNTDPTRASIRWDKDRSQANTKDKVLIRVPASQGDDKPLSDPEAKRFTFEMEEFAVKSSGLDLAGQVRVESVSLNDRDDDLDEQTGSGLKAPLAVQKADPKPADADEDTPVIGTVRFQNSRLVFGSLKAGFQLRLFDDAHGTISFLMSEDPAQKQLSVTGTVEINSPVEYRLDALFAVFQLKSVRLSTTVSKQGNGQVKWSSEGSVSGSAKFLPPPGKSASGPLAAMSDFFSGLTCEFEDLNPVKLGRGAQVTFNFPPKTFNLANVMEVDLHGITVGDNKKNSDRNQFGLLGEVRLKDLPGVGGTLTFGGIDLTESDSGLPDLDIKQVGAALTLPGGVAIDATFVRIKNQEESGFAGSMTLKSESLPRVSGLLKLTAVRCIKENCQVPSLALFLGAAIDAPLIFGFYLRGLGMGLGIFQGLRGLTKKDTNGLSITERVMKFVDDPRGLPDPGVIESWQPDPPDEVRSPLNWMLVAQALITYGNLPPNRPHIMAGTLLGALDQDLRLTVGTNIWLFASPEEIVKQDFRLHPAARGAIQISPREGKVFAYFRTLPNPKLGSEAPELVGQILNNVQTSCMFLADGNGFLTEIGWPWETRASLPLPSPLRGELTAGFRFGIYRGVTCYGLNFGIDVQMNADVGFDFDTPLGSAGAHLSIRGSGYFRASFVGALDQAQRPNLLGDVRVAATVAIEVEAHAELSKKITRWFKIRLRISFRKSFNLSISAALAAAMDELGRLGFSGDAHVALCVSGYRISGQVPFQYNPDRVGKVRDRLVEILPPPINQAAGGAPGPSPFFLLAAAQPANFPEHWHYRLRRVPNTNRILIALLPTPGEPYPQLADPDDAANPLPDDRFKIKLKTALRPKFKGFLLGGASTLTTDDLVWHEGYDGDPLITVDEMRAEYERLEPDDVPPEQPSPRDLTVALFLHGLGQSDTEEAQLTTTDETIDPRTINPSPDDVDDETVGVAPPDHRSPNFGRDTEYDRSVARACSRNTAVQNGKSARSAARGTDGQIDGPSASMLAMESLDLFENNTIASRADLCVERKRGEVDYFIAHRLRNVLVFEFDQPSQAEKELLAKADRGEEIAAEFLDLTSFEIEHNSVTLQNAVEENREYDLVVGHQFQSRDIIGLCWDFKLEQPDASDKLAAYKKGFEHFRVTRFNESVSGSIARVEIVHACWLDPTKGGTNQVAATEDQLIRPQMQYVDRDLGDPNDPKSEIREGHELTYRIEAIGQRGKILSACLFSVVRRTIRPLKPPVAAQALHKPKTKSAPTADQPQRVIDDGAIELSLLSPIEDSRNTTPRDVIDPAEVRVSYRLVDAATVGSYGFDAPIFASTRSETGLPGAASEGLDGATVRFSASPQSRPLPWEETTSFATDHDDPLAIKAEDWELLSLPLPKVNENDPDEVPIVQRVLRTSLRVRKLLQIVTKDFGADALRTKAIELWIGREKESQNNQPFERSILVSCRHALFLPDGPVLTARAGEVHANHFIQGSMVGALEPLPPFVPAGGGADTYLKPNRICAEVVASPVPRGSNPNDSPSVPNDVRIALSWRMPAEPVQKPFNPVIGYRIYRADRFNPVLHRVSPNGLAPVLERTVSVVTERLYRATPEMIELLPIVEQSLSGKKSITGDWRVDLADDESIWTPTTPLPSTPKELPFKDDPDRLGSTFLHREIVFVAERFADAIKAVLGSGARIRPMWRVREPFDDRADLQATDDRGNEAEIAKAKEARFRSAFEAFVASHEGPSDPYGWSTAESLGLSSEVIFVHGENNEPVDLDALIRRTTVLTELRTIINSAAHRPSVALLTFLADDGETLLNVVRVLYVGELPDWDATALGFDLRLALSLKLLGRDSRRPWPYVDDFPTSGRVAAAWLRDSLTPRLRVGLSLDDLTQPDTCGGRLHIYRRSLAVSGESPTAVVGSALPIQDDGTVRLDLRVPDRLAHVYDIALEPRRRYDELWELLDPSAVAASSATIPFDRIFPVKVDRTRPLTPHNLIATPLPGAIQSYVFAHPAEFAACASAINAAAIEYSGHNVYLQRRIPRQQEVEEILKDRTTLDVNWAKYRDVWLADRNYEEVAAPNQALSQKRELLLKPPLADKEQPPDSWDPMRMLPITRSGIYGADRYVIPDLPAYYEYRTAALSAAGAAQSAPSFTPFVKPLFHKVIQPPTTDGYLFVQVTDDANKTLVELQIVLGHPRLHLREEMRGLWVESDEHLKLLESDGTTIEPVKFGSLPDLELEYQLLFNCNFDKDDPNAFKVLNPLVGLIPPLDPQRAAEPFFLARSPDEQSVKIIDEFDNGTLKREAPVKYLQDADGSIRLVVKMVVGDKTDADNDTPKSRTLRELLRQAGNRKQLLFTFIVFRNGVQSSLIDAQEIPT